MAAEVKVLPALMVTEMAFAGLAASTHPATASAAQSFDFIISPFETSHCGRHQHGSQNSRVNYWWGAMF
jgi:hypothetical protein